MAGTGAATRFSSVCRVSWLGWGTGCFFPRTCSCQSLMQTESSSRSAYISLRLWSLYCSAESCDGDPRNIDAKLNTVPPYQARGPPLRISRWLYPPFLFVMVTLINFGLPPTIWTDGHTIWLATATAGAAVLWLGMFGFALFRIQASGTLFGSRSSDLGVVRALADAYAAIIAGGTSDFRSFAEPKSLLISAWRQACSKARCSVCSVAATERPR